MNVLEVSELSDCQQGNICFEVFQEGAPRGPSSRGGTLTITSLGPGTRPGSLDTREITDLLSLGQTIPGHGTLDLDTGPVALADHLQQGDCLLLTGDLSHWRTGRLALAARACGVDVLVLADGAFDLIPGVLARYEVTVSDWQPWRLRATCQRAPSSMAALAAQREVWVGGARSPRWLKERLITQEGVHLIEHYSGRNWSGFCAIEPRVWLAQPDSVGQWLAFSEAGEHANAQPPLADWLVDDAGEPVVAGTIGRLAIPGLVGADMDAGFLLQDTWFCPLGAFGERVPLGGGYCYPAEGETVLENHPAVAEAALIAILPEEQATARSVLMSQELLAKMPIGFVAIVELMPGDAASASPLLELELLEYAQQQLSLPKAPHSIGFVDALPRRPSGRVDLVRALSGL